MPCDTKVMVNLEDNKWNALARKKLGLPEKGALDVESAKAVRLEAGKLKTISVIKAINPTAMITGTALGVKKLTIDINI
jgi:hypothetical protein